MVTCVGEWLHINLCVSLIGPNLLINPLITLPMEICNFFFERQIYYYNNQASVQDEQKPINKDLQNKSAVYKRNTDKNTQTYTT
jgi:hypothetical protein